MSTEVWGAQRLLFSRREAALLLNLSQRQLDRIIVNGKLEVKKIGRRVLLTRDELKRFVDNGHATLA